MRGCACVCACVRACVRVCVMHLFFVMQVYTSLMDTKEQRESTQFGTNDVAGTVEGQMLWNADLLSCFCIFLICEYCR